MKKILILVLSSILVNSAIQAQNIQCIGDSINISLQEYKIGNIQWQFSNDTLSWMDLTGKTKAELHYTINETGFFRAKVSYGNCLYFSNLTYIVTYHAPEKAIAGTDQYITNADTVVLLGANSPIIGTGKWSIASGSPGTFLNDTSPSTDFIGRQCTDYVLIWTISTACASSSDTVRIGFHALPTVADAGPDQGISNFDTIITLAANLPIIGKGKWSIVSGLDGKFENDTNPGTKFKGRICSDYILRWSIKNACKVSSKDIHVGFHPESTINNDDSLRLENHGKLFIDLATYAGAFRDSLYYGLTRTGLTDAKMYIYDTKNHIVRNIIKINNASGSWAIDGDSVNLYIGTYSYNGDSKARIFKYNIPNNIIQELAILPTEQFVWSLIKQDSCLYIGTYPNAKIYEYNLKKNVLTDFGSVSNQKYVRALQFYNNKLYAGIGAVPELVEYDLKSHSYKYLLPDKYKSESMTYFLKIIDSSLLIGLDPSTKILLMDLRTYSFQELCDTVTNLPVLNSFTKGIKTFSFFGNLLTYNDTMNLLYRFQNHDLYNSYIKDNVIKGFSPQGIFREIEINGNISYNEDLVDQIGIATYPMSLEANDGNVFMGGKRITSYNIFCKTHNSIVIVGEAKTMKIRDTSLYCATYTGAYIYRYPENLANIINGTDVKYLITKINKQQNRPLCSVLGNRDFIVGTEPEYGLYGGALVFVPLSSDRNIIVIRNFVLNHSIYSLAIDTNNLFVGTSVWGGTGTNPLSENAHLVKYDLNSGEILFDAIPIKNNNKIKDMESNNDFIFCLSERGSLYKISSNTGEVKDSAININFREITKTISNKILAITGTKLYLINEDLSYKEIFNSFHNLSLLTGDSKRNIIYFFDQDTLYSLEMK